MQSIAEILYLHEDDIVEMKQGGRVPLQEGGKARAYDLFNPYSEQRKIPGVTYAKEYKPNQAAAFIEKNFGVNLTGKESPEEIGHLFDLLSDFEKQIPNLSPRNRGGVYLAGKRASLKRVAQDYTDFGKENLEAMAKEMGINYADSHREQRTAIKKYLAQRKSASSADDARLLFDKQDEIEATYKKLVENYQKQLDTNLKGELISRRMGAGERQKLRQEAINRVAGRERSEIARNLKNFKNKDVVLIYKKGDTGVKRVVDVVFKDPKKQAEFVSDLELRYLYPESSGGGLSSYAKDAGVMDQEAFRKKYFKEYSKSTVDDITAAVAKSEGFPAKPTMKDFIQTQQIKYARHTPTKGPTAGGTFQAETNAQRIKAMKDLGFRHYIDEAGNLQELAKGQKTKKRKIIDELLDPFKIKSDIRNQKISMGLDTSHSVKNPLLDPRRPGPQFKAETLETLYPVKSALNQGDVMQKFDRSVLNIAEDELEKIAKQRFSLIDETGRIVKGKEDEFARLQAKGKKIARNYSQADELFGVKYKGAGVGKASGPKNVKGVLNFEILVKGPDGKLIPKPSTGPLSVEGMVGGDRFKSYAGLNPDPATKTAFAQADTQVTRSKMIEIAKGKIDDIKQGISGLKGRELGTVCRAISKFGFAVGGNVTASCLKAIDDNPARAIAAISKISKPAGKLRNIVNLSKNLAKGTGYALLGELAVAAPIALYQYGQGESKERMIGDATYGLAGQTTEEEDKEFMGEGGFRSHKLVDDLGQLDNLTAQFQDSETIMMPEDEELNIQQMDKKEKDIAEGLKFYEKEDGSFDRDKFDRDFDTGTAGLKNKEDVKGFRRDVRRDEDYDVFEDEVMAAKGGLISLKPRKPEALPPESGPNPQGLENLKYYVTNT